MVSGETGAPIQRPGTKRANHPPWIDVLQTGKASPVSECWPVPWARDPALKKIAKT